MLLLRSVLSHTPDTTICEAFFDSAFMEACDPGPHGGLLVPAAICLELVAQTMAVHDGLLRRAEGRPRATRGLLLGSRKFELLARELPATAPLRVVASGQLNDTTLASAGLVRFHGCVESLDGATVFARGDVTVLEHRPPPPGIEVAFA